MGDLVNRDRPEVATQERARVALAQSLASDVIALFDDAGASLVERLVVLDMVRGLTSLRRELVEPD